MRTMNIIREQGVFTRASWKKILAGLMGLSIFLLSFLPVFTVRAVPDELNLLPASAEELNEKIWLNTGSGATLTYMPDGSTEIYSPASWPTFQLLSAANFAPTASPLYLYYDFTLTGGVMKLDLHVNNSAENPNDALKNIFKNNTTSSAGDLASRTAPYKGVINVTEVFGEDIDVINAITGIVSHNGVRLNMRELRLSVIPPVTPPDFNLLPASVDELSEKVWLDTNNGATLNYKPDGSTEIYVPTSWPTFRFLSAADFVPLASPLYLYYDFTLAGGSMKLDFHVNDSGENLNAALKNIFKNNATDVAGDLTGRAAPYQGVVNITEVFGTNIDVINSVVGIFAANGSYLTFRELRLSAVPPPPPVIPDELNLLPESAGEVNGKVWIDTNGGASVSYKADGSTEILSPTGWPTFRFDAAAEFVPAGTPLYLYYDFTLTGEGAKAMALDLHVNNRGENLNSVLKNIFKNNLPSPAGDLIARAAPYQGVINVTEVFGENITVINSIVGIISGENMCLNFRELKLSVIPPPPPVIPREINLLPSSASELNEKIWLDTNGGASISYEQNGSTEIKSPTGWPTFRFDAAADFIPAASPLYLYYNFTLSGEGARVMMLDLHVNNSGEDFNAALKNIFKNNLPSPAGDLIARTAPYEGVINVTEIFGEDIRIVNSIIGIISGENMCINFRELKLSVDPPAVVPEIPKEINLLPESASELNEKIWIDPNSSISASYKDDGSTEIFSPTSWPTFRFEAASGYLPAGSPLYLYYDFTLAGGGAKAMALDIHVNDKDDNIYAALKNIFTNNKTSPQGDTIARTAPYKGVINVSDVFGENIRLVNSIVGIISGENMRLTLRELKLSVIAPDIPVDVFPDGGGGLPTEPWKMKGTTLNLLPTTQEEVETQSKISSHWIENTDDSGQLKVEVTLRDDGSVNIHSAALWPIARFRAADYMIPSAEPLYLYYDFSLSGGEACLEVHVNEDTDVDNSRNNIIEGGQQKGTLGPKNCRGVANLTEALGKINIINSLSFIISGTDLNVTFRRLELSTVAPGDSDKMSAAAYALKTDGKLNLLPTTQEEVDNQSKIYSLSIDETGANGEKITVTLEEDSSVTVHNAINWPTFRFVDAAGMTFDKSPVYLYYDLTLDGGEMCIDMHINKDEDILNSFNNVLERAQKINTIGRPKAYKGAVDLTDIYGDIDIVNSLTAIISGTDISVNFRRFELSYETPEMTNVLEKVNIVTPVRFEEPDESVNAPVSNAVLYYILAGGGGAVIIGAGAFLLIKRKALMALLKRK